MDPQELVRVGVAEPSGSNCAPVTALHAEFGISEPLRHQRRDAIGDLLDAEPLLPRRERQAVARQRRRDNREGIRRIAAEARRVGQARDDVEELEHRTGPAMQQQQRQRRRPLPGHMQKMQADVEKPGLELRERVEARLLRPPIETPTPIIHQLP